MKKKKNYLIKGMPKLMTNNNEVYRSVNDENKPIFMAIYVESQLSIDDGNFKFQVKCLFTWNEPFYFAKGMWNI